MEAHAGTIRIGQLHAMETAPVEGKATRLRFFRKAARVHGVQPRSIPGSEHSHLILPPKAY
jgi:hypothetical protein